MDDKWKIELYESARGEKLVEDFFDSLEVKARLKINHAIELQKKLGLLKNAYKSILCGSKK